MSNSRRLAGFDLVHLLLLLTVAELALNRLAVPALRPPGDVIPPSWHQILDHLGLFLFYFASVLAIAVVGRHLWRLRRRKELYSPGTRLALVATGAVFVVLAMAHIVVDSSEGASFALESAFIAAVLALVAGQLVGRGDVAARIGIALIAVPLVVHYYGPLALRLWAGPEAVWAGFPEQVQRWGQWCVVIVALLSPYCFAPRPFVQSAARLSPLVIGTFVGVVGAIIVRQHYEVGWLVASRGLGVELGPGAPAELLALYLLGLGTVTWTMTSCLTAEAPARREIGVGLALIVAAGYGFAWPLQYLACFAGLLVLGESAAKVANDERAAAEPTRSFRGPPIADEVWERYVAAAVETLRGPAATASSAVTSRDGQAGSVTHLVTERRGVRVAVRIERAAQVVTTVDVSCGAALPDAPPAWTMYARPERLLGIGAHPQPPDGAGDAVKTGDAPFDQRFRLRDRADHTAALLDDGLRARATALIDGWVAWWPDGALHYRVHPGHGAPLDHPVPITELAFRGVAEPAGIERLAAVIDLLVDVSARGATPAAPAATEPAAATAATDDDTTPSEGP